jgi:hypothetical protein
LLEISTSNKLANDLEFARWHSATSKISLKNKLLFIYESRYYIKCIWLCMGWK